MSLDDDEPTRPRRLQPAVLGPMGVAELAAYIHELNVEITRVEEEIGRKQHHKLAADSVFRKP